MNGAVARRQLREAQETLRRLTSLCTPRETHPLDRLEGLLAYERWRGLQPAETFQ